MHSGAGCGYYNRANHAISSTERFESKNCLNLCCVLEKYGIVLLLHFWCFACVDKVGELAVDYVPWSAKIETVECKIKIEG